MVSSRSASPCPRAGEHDSRWGSTRADVSIRGRRILGRSSGHAGAAPLVTHEARFDSGPRQLSAGLYYFTLSHPKYLEMEGILTAFHQYAGAILIVGLMLSACTAPPTAARNGPAAALGVAFRPWTTNDVVGLTISLIDPLVIQSMSFTLHGTVPYTAGRKNGWITGPLFRWKLHDGRLQIVDHENRLKEELSLVSRDASTIVARRRSGMIARYRIVEQRTD